MRLNSKFTWGLAWAGLALVLIVPSADFLTGKATGNKAAVLTSDTDPVVTDSTNAVTKTASVTMTTTATGVTITPAGSDPVDTLLKSGKKLPDYISGPGTAPATATTVPASTSAPSLPAVDATTGTVEPTKVASVDPAPKLLVAPVPYPLSLRPHEPVTVAATPKAEQPLIVDESVGEQQQAALDTPRGPVPPADIVGPSDDWNAASLRAYLERKGILDESPRSHSSADVTYIDRPADNYDPNGFFLNEGPNVQPRRHQRWQNMQDDQDQYDDEDDQGFTLF